ncbi:MAG: GSCFA domain-containing protein [Sphingobacteriales bacterium]|nr:MAG: GSCFA domain-containing protein [Sphingobacteriales bacterium]
MQLTLNIDIPALPQPLKYNNKILLIGSCFTENMADRMVQHKFRLMTNPHGILFNPLSVAYSLDSYVNNKQYKKEDLFQLNELWNSWDHHTRFSHIDADKALEGINAAQQQAATMVREAGWIIITLGSAFQYYLKDNDKPVANNHRAPAQWFEKKLLTIDTIVSALEQTINKIKAVNPNAQMLFTISPVRHIRDGVVDNNRSKARLIEAVHELCSLFDHAHYFPAYELVIDILRDYRFYDIDFVHPNYLATSVVWEHFVKSCIHPGTQMLMKELHEITTARQHRSRFPETEAHRKFLASYAEKARSLMQRYPDLNLREELAYFSADTI